MWQIPHGTWIRLDPLGSAWIHLDPVDSLPYLGNSTIIWQQTTEKSTACLYSIARWYHWPKKQGSQRKNRTIKSAWWLLDRNVNRNARFLKTIQHHVGRPVWFLRDLPVQTWSEWTLDLLAATKYGTMSSTLVKRAQQTGQLVSI